MSRTAVTVPSSTHPASGPVEVELKFVLAGDPPALASRLAGLLCLAASPVDREPLDSIYFDTPDHALRKARMALRVRRSEDAQGVHWVQTLKTAPALQEALSRRGEWETAVPGPAPDRDALQATPWLRFDPLGVIFSQLEPVFRTRFERTAWQVTCSDGTRIEVALDVGEIEAAGRTERICELELELLSGHEHVLFGLAMELAAQVPLLPSSQSKAERGWRLASGDADRARRATALPLDPALALQPLAAQVLAEMFGQFSDNLARLPLTPDAEVLHQARVGWRRLRSGLRLFRPALPEPPSWAPLRPLLTLLGECRDLDVVRMEVLPPLSAAWIAGDDARAQAWDALNERLHALATARRAAALAGLSACEVSVWLVRLQGWLHGLANAASAAPGAAQDGDQSAPGHRVPKAWIRHRLAGLDRRLRDAAALAQDAQARHRVRILAKRLRYGAEAMRALLPLEVSGRWHERALGLQTRLGDTRDVDAAIALAQQLEADPGLLAFLRGVAAGREPRR